MRATGCAYSTPACAGITAGPGLDAFRYITTKGYGSRLKAGTTESLLALRFFRHPIETILHLFHLTAQFVHVVAFRGRLRCSNNLPAAGTPPRGGTNGLNIEKVC